MAEYALLVSLISIIALVTVRTLGREMKCTFAELAWLLNPNHPAFMSGDLTECVP